MLLIKKMIIAIKEFYVDKIKLNLSDQHNSIPVRSMLKPGNMVLHLKEKNHWYS